ncbi:hypothetical protein Pcac1_g1076 [Phytophthora cactorum]|nr:hypothetical protein Pcac1_g1076 [Phytophthora cactorum]
MHDKYENIATPARGENVKKGVENLDIAMVLIKRKDKGKQAVIGVLDKLLFLYVYTGGVGSSTVPIDSQVFTCGNGCYRRYCQTSF